MAQQTSNYSWITYVISGSALIVSILSFSWDRLRQTKLIIFAPRYFVISSSFDEFKLMLPLTFKADGPKPLLIQDLQLIQLSNQLPIKFMNVANKYSGNNPPYTINAGQQLTLNCVFKGKLESEKNALTEKLEIQALIGNSNSWKKLCQVSLINCEKEIDRSGVITSMPDPFE